MQTNPLGVLAAVLVAGMLLVVLLAWRLASRTAEPVARFERAAAQLALGTSPDLLPETGPRELADLARHFNRMATQVRERFVAGPVLPVDGSLAGLLGYRLVS